MSDVNLTLYRIGETVYNYEIQFSTVFEDANYQTSDYEVVSVPERAGETLMINLYVSSGRDSQIVHNVTVGEFPNSIPDWILDVQYLDQHGIVKKKVKTEQAQGDSEPRPIDQNRL
jgi:hypothetical protein